MHQLIMIYYCGLHPSLSWRVEFASPSPLQCLKRHLGDPSSSWAKFSSRDTLKFCVMDITVTFSQGLVSAVYHNVSLLRVEANILRVMHTQGVSIVQRD